MATTNCGICTEKYNKTTRCQTACPYCDYTACRNCCETWVLNETTPRCMSCGKEWTRQFVASVFPKSFMNAEYKTHREAVLFDQERALMPATQPLIENQLHCEKLNKEIRRIEVEELSEIYARLQRLRSERNQLATNRRTEAERCVFIRACPDGECRGFLSQSWKCGICEKWACSECHEIKGLTRDCPHECDPSTLATAKLLATDTKSCPTCGTGIHKLEGCDQMFCTICNTGFSWRTGRIETNIHNPHYFEWMRRTGGEAPRNPNEIQCGREITHEFARQLVGRLRRAAFENVIITRVSNYCESIIHMRYEELPRFEVNHVLNNQDLRIQYMRNHISEDYFKTQIQRQDKKHKKHQEIHNILMVLYNTATDILYRFDDGVRSQSSEPMAILDEMNTIVAYVNECLDNIGTAYGSKAFAVNERLRLM